MALVVLLLLLAGVIPGLVPVTHPTTIDTEAQAATAAQPVVAKVSDGPWNLSFAEGWAYVDPSTLVFYGPANCSGPAHTITATDGPYSGDFRLGAAVLWVLIYLSPNATGSELEVEVDQGAVTDLGIAPSACPVLALASGIGVTIDSSTAVSIVLATSRGSTYAGTFSTANASYILNGAAAGRWVVQFGACDGLTVGPGELLAGAWATNGTITDLSAALAPC